MKKLLLFTFLVSVFAQIQLINEIIPEDCHDCNFQINPAQRSSLINDNIAVITGTEKTKSGSETPVLFIYYKDKNRYIFHKKLTMPPVDGKLVGGKIQASLSQGKLLVGFIRDIPGGDKDKQQALLFEKPSWRVTKEFPIHWTDEPRPREGSLRTDVKTVAICGDYAIIGGLYFHNYGIWVNFPIGYSKTDNWTKRWGTMNHMNRSPIATGFNGKKKPNFLLTITSHSYVMFEPIDTKNKTNIARFKTSLYGVNGGSFGNWAAIDKTGEVVLHSQTGSILVWYKPREGRGYSYVPDTIIRGTNDNFGSSFAAFNDKKIVAVSGDGKVYVYERESTEFKNVQEISINGIQFETVSQNVDDDGSFVVMGRKNGKVVAYIYRFQ